MIDIAELRKLEAAATPGPWKRGENGNRLHLFEPRFDVAVIQVVSGEGYWSEDPRHDRVDSNIDLVAAARNALVPLLDEIERLRTQNSLAEEFIFQAGKWIETVSGEELPVWQNSVAQYRRSRDRIKGGE